jgi:hypothetical protein
MGRTLRLIEPLAVFASIMAYIWLIRSAHPWLVVPILPLVVFSHFARDERAPSLGFRATQLSECIRKFGPVLAALVLIAVAGGRLLGTIRPIGLDRAALGFALYLPWGLFQQYLLNGYFLKRFDTVLPPLASDATTAALFSAVHCPNLFLMLLTPVAGYVSIQIYRRYRNLYFLGIAHATIGILLFMVFPDTVIHHLNIGPAAR